MTDRNQMPVTYKDHKGRIDVSMPVGQTYEIPEATLANWERMASNGQGMYLSAGTREAKPVAAVGAAAPAPGGKG